MSLLQAFTASPSWLWKHWRTEQMLDFCSPQFATCLKNAKSESLTSPVKWLEPARMEPFLTAFTDAAFPSIFKKKKKMKTSNLNGLRSWQFLGFQIYIHQSLNESTAVENRIKVTRLAVQFSRTSAGESIWLQFPIISATFDHKPRSKPMDFDEEANMLCNAI